MSKQDQKEETFINIQPETTVKSMIYGSGLTKNTIMSLNGVFCVLCNVSE